MMYIIKFEDEIIGEALMSRSTTDEEICEIAGVQIAVTQEDFENMPENGKYDLDTLVIESKKEK